MKRNNETSVAVLYFCYLHSARRSYKKLFYVCTAAIAMEDITL